MAADYLIFGLGVSGLSALKYLVSQGQSVTIVNAGAPTTWKHYLAAEKLGPDTTFIAEEEAKATDFANKTVVLSPGIPRTHPLLKRCPSEQIINEIDLVAHEISCPIWAVTGTNGKTTTVSLLTHLLNKTGINTWVGGNIGHGLSELVASGESRQYDLIVLELSSFQLESLRKVKFQAAAMLNLTSSHGERYGNISDYAAAKANIFRLLEKNGKGFLREQDQSFYRPLANSENIQFLTTEKIAGVESFKLPGEHNLENLQFCYAMIKQFHPSLVSTSQWSEAMASFTGVAHRLEHIYAFAGIKIFNDAKSTNWDATEKAVGTFSAKEDLYLIVGGQVRGRGEDTDGYGKKLGPKVKKLFAFGEARENIVKSFAPYCDCEAWESVEQVVQQLQNLQAGIILLSPAYPSFDQFPNYVARGEAFKKICGKFFKDAQ